MPTASPWCQRWRQRTHSWRHVSEGGFDARHYEVEPISEKDAEAFVRTHHYSATYPAAVRRFGLYDVSAGERRLSSVAVFGVPVNQAVLTKALPELAPVTEALECSRFVLLDECPGNFRELVPGTLPHRAARRRGSWSGVLRRSRPPAHRLR
ncbi:hypothetical protein ABTZ58_39670 [Streptomyces sp. NPDC094143]|uniref:Mom family adenine methylcarbamoylation protein n=1 Tax=Streptomyces sp. NPDC094143 TaxID=3155310 RepID=UPI00331E012D